MEEYICDQVYEQNLEHNFLSIVPGKNPVVAINQKRNYSRFIFELALAETYYKFLLELHPHLCQGGCQTDEGEHRHQYLTR